MKTPVPDPGPVDDVLDQAQLGVLRQLGSTDRPDFLAGLVAKFLGPTTDRMIELREASDRADAQAVERGAHALKGSAATMGATLLAQACAEVEDAGRSGRLGEVPDGLRRVAVELDRASQALLVEARTARDP